jgi:hypothetical protein
MINMHNKYMDYIVVDFPVIRNYADQLGDGAGRKAEFKMQLIFLDLNRVEVW